MAGQFSRSYTGGHAVRTEGSVEFACSTDLQEWPWLALGPHHPVVVQAQNFWTSVGGALTLGGLCEGQWSALTWTTWQCGNPGVGIATRGVYSRETEGEKEHYRVVLFDGADREIVQMRGRGVIFRNRNFEEWRKGSKREAALSGSGEDFAFAPREALGIGEREHPLVGTLDGDRVPALVTRANGLPPANPMLGGSGDHVNSVHMIEAARQALCLLGGEPVRDIAGGEMELNRYVELGTPFELEVAERINAAIVLVLRQLGHDCARLTLRV
ncbi:MAG: hypothetical protein ACX930_15275 [Erythrobacter sp.]